MSNGNPIVPPTRRDPYRLVGEVFDGRYRIEAFVSSGSFGAVYRAVNMRFGKTVAVKVLKPDLKEDLAETARELFQREGLTAGSLDHPHIVNVTDVGEEFGFAYMVMEWLEGRTLEAEIKNRKYFTPEDATKILSDIADALHTAHEQGVVHRDIKPSNIHLGREERTTVKVLDFGIAKVISSASQAMASRIAGTLEYASPEQISGGRIDRCSDIYSLGVMMYQMLTGELPFKANSEAQLIQMHLMEPPPKLSEKRGDLSEEVSNVIAKAMAKSSEDRFQSALEFKQAFIDSLSWHKAVDPSEMKTLIAVTKASPIETETHSTPQAVKEKQINAQFLNARDNFQTGQLTPKDTQGKKLSDTTQEKSIKPSEASRGKRYTLYYAIGGALFMFIFRYFFWQEIPYSRDIKMETLFAVDIPFGLFIGVILSEMRPAAWWSVAKSRRFRASEIYALTGAAILYGGIWTVFHFNFFLKRWQIFTDENALAEYYISECHNLINQYVPAFIPVGLVFGLAVWSVRVLSHKEKDNASAEIKPEAKENKSKLGIYLTIGSAIFSFIVSLIYYKWSEYYVQASQFPLIFHTMMGASLGLIIGQLLRPSGMRWSITDGFHGRSILIHGFTAFCIISFAAQLQFFIYIFIVRFGNAPLVQEFLKAEYHTSPISALLMFRATVFYFTIGMIVWFARLLVHKTNRPGLIYTLCGLLCAFVLSWSKFPRYENWENWLPYCLLNMLFGTVLFASLSELRRGALWSVAKGRRVKAFLVHAATGVTIIMGIGWLLWSSFVLTETRLGFAPSSVYILLAALALIGFVLGLIVCGLRVGINEALSGQT